MSAPGPTPVSVVLWAVGMIYAFVIGYLLFALLGLFQFFGVADPVGVVTARNPWNWISWNLLFTPENAEMLGFNRQWWHRLATNDLRLPLQLIVAFLALTLADWLWRMTLGRLQPH